MGVLSRSAIVSQGLNVAGDVSITTLANINLNTVLRKIYASWQWPFLLRRWEGFSLVAGTRSIAFGAGAAAGPTNPVKEIKDPLWLYDSSYGTAMRVKVRQWMGGEIFDDETTQNPTTNRGAPREMKIRAQPLGNNVLGVWGQWFLVPNPVPDRNYLLAIDYWEQPADLDTTTSGDAVVPVYPNDQTLIQIVTVFGLQRMKRRQEWNAEKDILAQMLIDDRARYGNVDGTNDNLGLDPGVYRLVSGAYSPSNTR